MPIALDTLRHTSTESLLEQIGTLIANRNIDLLVVGMPLLLDGTPGSQSAYVEEVIAELEGKGFAVETIDERYSSKAERGVDDNAAAAVQLLQVYLDKKSN